ncbi:MAG: hypothetical protein IKS15_01100 [Opitutales bacterium]|nr:hypothetical protein [Opitutales bacterium]
MLKKLLTTRYFALKFNKIADCVGEKGGVAGVVLAYFFAMPIMLAVLAFFNCLVWSLPIDVSLETENQWQVADFLMMLIIFLSVSLAVFFIRIFARGFSGKAFFFTMLPSMLFCLWLVISVYSVGIGIFLWGAFFLLLEELAAMAVLFQKSYTNYRAFQVVGSLFLIILGFIFYYADVSKNLLGVERLGGDKIFLAAVVLFWILSRAHILFRDKLLDYLESREK